MYSPSGGKSTNVTKSFAPSGGTPRIFGTRLFRSLLTSETDSDPPAWFAPSFDPLLPRSRSGPAPVGDSNEPVVPAILLRELASTSCGLNLVTCSNCRSACRICSRMRSAERARCSCACSLSCCTAICFFGGMDVPNRPMSITGSESRSAGCADGVGLSLFVEKSIDDRLFARFAAFSRICAATSIISGSICSTLAVSFPNNVFAGLFSRFFGDAGLWSRKFFAAVSMAPIIENGTFFFAFSRASISFSSSSLNFTCGI
mmetsp:Transcript_971/g.2027  ORF Transcript_971/g.2027 Transcript_971/m.2027 type:complete len:259 (+) Transcript_971:1836-2612(+)